MPTRSSYNPEDQERLFKEIRRNYLQKIAKTPITAEKLGVPLVTYRYWATKFGKKFDKELKSGNNTHQVKTVTNTMSLPKKKTTTHTQVGMDSVVLIVSPIAQIATVLRSLRI